MTTEENYVNLSIALRGSDRSEILSQLKISTDYLNLLTINLVKEMKPTEKLPIRIGNINGPYVNLPAHISTVDLLSRMNLEIDGQVYDEMDIKLIHQTKILSNNDFNQDINRLGGYYILLKDLK